MLKNKKLKMPLLALTTITAMVVPTIAASCGKTKANIDGGGGVAKTPDKTPEQEVIDQEIAVTAGIKEIITNLTLKEKQDLIQPLGQNYLGASSDLELNSGFGMFAEYVYPILNGPKIETFDDFNYHD